MGEWTVCNLSRYANRGVLLFNSAGVSDNVVMEVAMYAYLGLTLPVIVAAVIVDLFLLKTRVVASRNFWIVLGIMLGFTLVFDQFFTGLPIVEYDFSKTSGVKLFHAPIEDFSYTIVATILIGSALAYVKRVSKP